MWSGYGYLNSTEIWNNQRVLDYLLGNPAAGAAGIAQPTTVVTPNWSCGTANRLFCEPPLGIDDYRYTNVADDDAPWYDPLYPESEQFAGLFVTEMTGFDSIVDRNFTQGALYGGNLGPLKLNGRTITVTGWLRASTCCAAEYGLRWLQEALIGDSGCADCALGELVMLKCCPPDDDLSPEAATYIRYLEQVGLVDGPKVTDRQGTCCASCGYTNLQVQFTLASQSPYIYSEPTWCAYNEAFDPTEDWTCFSTDCDPCAPSYPTTWTPDCGPAPIVPPAPFVISNQCYCDPWCAKKLTCSFENSAQWNDLTGIVEIKAGSAEIKNLKIQAFKNTMAGMPTPPDDHPYTCDDFFAGDYRCAARCSVIEIGQLPSGSTLTIDGRTRTVALRLAGGNYVPGLRYISGEDGGPFDWIDIPHCSDLCVLVTVDCSAAADARVTVGYVNKFLASGG